MFRVREKRNIGGGNITIVNSCISQTITKGSLTIAIVGGDEIPLVGQPWEGCVDSHATLVSNEHCVPGGIAMIGCGNASLHDQS